MLPGVTVTLTGPVAAAAADRGRPARRASFQFPRLEIGTYNVKFELAGFKTVVNEGIQVTVGFSAQVNAQLGVSTVQETVTVTGESPIVDTKETGTKQTFTNELLQSIPSARDPWVILQQTAGIAMDRENIGGNMSGQQSNYVSRGGNPTNNKWSLDGVDITDMAATGASPSYYDFDAFEEMTINTGGVDVTQQTGGVGINLVTKSGTDKFKGSGALLRHRTDSSSRNNITDAQRTQGATLGQPDPGHQGLRRRARRPDQEGQGLDLGQLRQAERRRRRRSNFYQPTAACQAIKADGGRARRIDRRRQRLPEHRPDAARRRPTSRRKCSCSRATSCQPLQQLREEGAQRARRRRPAPDRDDDAAGRGVDAVVRHQNWWNDRPEPDLQVRRPVGGQRPAAARRAVRARRQQLHPRLPRSPALADVQPTFIIADSLNGRSAPTAASVHPSGQQRQRSTRTTSCRARWAATTRSRSAATGATRSAYDSDHTGGYATVRFPTRDARPTRTTARRLADGLPGCS